MYLCVTYSTCYIIQIIFEFQKNTDDRECEGVRSKRSKVHNEVGSTQKSGKIRF